MTFGSTFPRRLTKIDDLTRPDHPYLTADDSCYFLGEYSARKGFAFSATNSLVLNFKKKMDRRARPEWQYKERAILDAASAFRTAIKGEWLNGATLVPVPPSKAKTDPMYDDRVVRMISAIRPTPKLDLRELVVQDTSTAASHESDDRPDPDEIAENYSLVKSLRAGVKPVIGIFDDVLTTGAHFKACQTVLRAAFPGARIIGLFIARRIPEAVDVEDWFEDLDA